MNIANLDLNLLVSLDALLRERSVTRAAERLGLTQPALSAALRRLRAHFGDELLTRVGNTYQLTPLAVFLLGRATIAMDGVERVFDAKPEFDPELCTREFVVLCSDYSLSVAGAPVVAALAARAPKARIRFRQPALAQIRSAADNLRTSDVGIHPHGFSVDLPHLDVFRDRWICIVAEGNERVGDRLTVDDLTALPWVSALDQSSTAYTPAHKQLQLQGAVIDIRVVTDSFLAVPAMVAGTDRVALLQERLARAIPGDLGIRVLDCPFDAPPLREALWWHPLSEEDPEHRLLRSAFADAALVLA
ncbi:LysR family transcriptional regulator [uncultured Amnibacterium sp.]|uniref:LysR family transcriptional regulator n=1 Tax=uncultured Amnibacterium sp. TaxID=1631851 RepID=UPI0035CB04AE